MRLSLLVIKSLIAMLCVGILTKQTEIFTLFHLLFADSTAFKAVSVYAQSYSVKEQAAKVGCGSKFGFCILKCHY